MKSVPVIELIKHFQTMYEEHWNYDWSGHEEGLVGCAGAFTYVFSLYGISYPNGSNAIERNKVVGGLLPLCQAEPGMAAFKAKSPGEDGYDLPGKYKISGASYNGDLTDYYHIGLVDEDKNYVLNAKGKTQGFCRDRLTDDNGWDFVAYIKNVDYGKEEDMGNTELFGDQAVVILPAGSNGSTVNMRENHSTSSGIIAKVPVGSEITVVEDQGQWCKIQYNGKTGWMMSNYIEYKYQDDETDCISEQDRKRINEALSSIRTQLDVISAIVGRG